MNIRVLEAYYAETNYPGAPGLSDWFNDADCVVCLELLVEGWMEQLGKVIGRHYTPNFGMHARYSFLIFSISLCK